MFENFKKLLKRTDKTCPYCEQETLHQWIVITPDGETLDIGKKCKNPLCDYTDLFRSDVIFDAFNKAKNKDINWWFFYLYNAIELCIFLHRTDEITDEAWLNVSLILKLDLMTKYGEEKYGKSDPQKVDGEWLEPSVLLDAIPSDGGHCKWRLIKAEDHNNVVDKVFGYYYRRN